MTTARFTVFNLGLAATVWAASGGLVSAQTLARIDHANSHLQRLRTARNRRRAMGASPNIRLSRSVAPRLLAPRLAFDTSGDGVLNGSYFVRQVLTLPDGNTSAITRAVSLT